MFSRSRLPLYATLLVITGCFSGEGVSCTLFPPNGLAGNGSFDYECTGGGDPECDDDTELFARDLPTRSIARGAQFKVTYNDPGKPVQSASQNALSSRGPGVFVAQRAGTVGLFVEADDAEQIEDAVRLRIAEPDRILVGRRGTAPFGEAALTVGKVETFRATASLNREALAGSLQPTWTVDAPDVAELETSRFGTCTLRGLRPGTVRLRASFDALFDEVTIEVKDANTEAPIDGGSTDASQD